jgi:6-phosphogluconolactonase/glucosamine-6-phosphate isomerase/deaminase
MIFLPNYKQAFNFILNNINPKGNVIISGGSNIKSILKFNSNKKNIFKRKVLLSDERLVRENSNLRNDKFFYNLINKKFIKKKNFYHYKYKNFTEEKIQILDNKIKNIKFQFAILGLGKNNHIASIFKESEYNIKKNYYLVTDSPKKPKLRVTVSLHKLKQTKLIFIVANKNKRKKEIQNLTKTKIFEILKSKIILIVVGKFNS